MTMNEIEKLVLEKKYIDAKKIAVDMLNKCPGNAESWLAMGIVNSAMGDFQWAIECFNKCIAIDSKNDVAYANLGYIYRAFRMNALSNESFDKVRELAPSALVPDNAPVVYICLPNYGMVHIDFAISLIKLILYTRENRPDIDIKICPCKGSRITSNRNRLAEEAMSKGATHIFFIDSDMLFEEDSLVRMLNHNVDIVCATTCKRGDDNGIPIGTAINKNSGEKSLLVKSGQGLIEMSHVGSCFMLIKSDVFKNIPLPAYYEPPEPSIGDAIGEDITFCKVVRNAGYQIWMDFDISVKLGHIGEKVYSIKPSIK